MRASASISDFPRSLLMRFPVVNHGEILYPNATLDVSATVEVPRFDVGEEALNYLKHEGYVIIRSVLNASDLEHAREDLLWSFLEGMGTGVERDKPSTYVKAQPNQYGIVWTHGVGHSRLAWFIRTRPRLLSFFSHFWNTEDLIASFEGFSFLPPLPFEKAWRLGVGWFHTDQNGKSRPGLQTIQSLTTLYDQDETTGAFVVVPRSWKRHHQLTERIYATPRPPADDQHSHAAGQRPHPVQAEAAAPCEGQGWRRDPLGFEDSALLDPRPAAAAGSRHQYGTSTTACGRLRQYGASSACKRRRAARPSRRRSSPADVHALAF